MSNGPLLIDQPLFRLSNFNYPSESGEVLVSGWREGFCHQKAASANGLNENTKESVPHRDTGIAKLIDAPEQRLDREVRLPKGGIR
jgi:hypothetical protein